MRGLLLKDFYTLKSSLKIMLLLIGVYGFIALKSQDYAMLNLIIAMMCVVLPLTSCGYDEKSHWDKLALSMPISRNDLALSKYIFGLLLATVGLLINVSLPFIIGSNQAIDLIWQSLTIYAASLVLLSFILPVIFKIGVEKGRLALFIIFILPTVMVMFVRDSSLPLPTQAQFDLFKIASPFLVVLVLMASMFLSTNILKKKAY